jgi:hypothetical protein
MQSKAKTVKQYIDSLPADRKPAITKVRNVILKNIPKGYAETMAYGMIGYVVPLKYYPSGYRNQKDVPLPFAGLASQKNHMALYLMITYGSPDLDLWFRKAYKAAGKKLDMGKGCVRFKRLDDLPLDVIAQLMRKLQVKEYIKRYDNIRGKK